LKSPEAPDRLPEAARLEGGQGRPGVAGFSPSPPSILLCAALPAAALLVPAGRQQLPAGGGLGEAIPRFVRAGGRAGSASGAAAAPLSHGPVRSAECDTAAFRLGVPPLLRDGAHHHKSVSAASKQRFFYWWALLDYVDVFFFAGNLLLRLRSQSTSIMWCDKQTRFLSQ